MSDALPARDPESLRPSAAARVGAHVLLGMLGGAWGAVLMALEEGVEGHGHGGGGSPFAMLPHQVLLAMPLSVLLLALLRETRPSRAVEALAAALAGLVAVDLLLA